MQGSKQEEANETSRVTRPRSSVVVESRKAARPSRRRTGAQRPSDAGRASSSGSGAWATSPDSAARTRATASAAVRPAAARCRAPTAAGAAGPSEAYAGTRRPIGPADPLQLPSHAEATFQTRPAAAAAGGTLPEDQPVAVAIVADPSWALASAFVSASVERVAVVAAAAVVVVVVVAAAAAAAVVVVVVVVVVVAAAAAVAVWPGAAVGRYS